MLSRRQSFVRLMTSAESSSKRAPAIASAQTLVTLSALPSEAREIHPGSPLPLAPRPSPKPVPLNQAALTAVPAPRSTARRVNFEPAPDDDLFSIMASLRLVSAAAQAVCATL